MSENKIAVINSKSFGRYFPEQIERLEAAGGVDFYRDLDPDINGKELADLLYQYEYLIPSVTPNFPREFFENTPNLKMISRHGLGFNNIDIEAATEHGVYVTKIVGDYERDTVAELSIGFIMALLRHIVPANTSLKNNEWSRKADFFGTELHAQTVGIIGIGNIGSRVSEILTNGFGTKVIAYDPYKDQEYMSKHGAKKVELDEFLAESDVISINACLTDTSYHLLGKEEFQKMKDGVLIANTGRGEVVDENAMLDALDAGKVKAYATDVFGVEPLPEDNKLKDYEYNIITPHIGAYTDLSLKAMGDKCVEDVELMVQGKEPKVIVNEGVKPK
ncbi:NAD(P)-dependent oxidoreductase [Aerococcus mictus]|uniref:NAD(P)-dependent oxidoreductase n=1 Tax=Aerococcus mictus TaxID=2976810 RepID=UPI000DCD47A2|nr:NAD(P)-dependent oxidoreductase [Aerococcus mictus]KAA9233773.1 hydroxyacid dehydrogenase [Aerococcus mictus]MDL5183883.1 NAD(P)-dependent oxidoreductase [Aerococcus mictus]